eukprot:403353874
MNVPDRIVADPVSIAQPKQKPQQQNSSLIHKADEFFQKKVPLVDVMNAIKELKESIPTIHKMELKIAIQEDRLTDIMVLLNDRQAHNQDIESLMKIIQDDNEKKLRDIIKVQEERIKDIIFKKADIEQVQELLNMKASKTDYGDLYKKYSQLYIGLEPLIINQDILKGLCKRIEQDDKSPDIEERFHEINRSIQRFEQSLENRNQMFDQFKNMKKEMRTLNKQVALLYDEHIYSIDEDDSEDEIEKKRRKTQKLQNIKQMALIDSPKRKIVDSSDSEADQPEEPKGLKPPTEEDLRDNLKLYQNVHGFSDVYLQKQKVLEDYKPEKLFRYLQSQVNDNFHYELKELGKDHSLMKEIYSNQVKDQTLINQTLQHQLEGIDNLIENELLSQKKIEAKFKDFNVRIENLIKSFDADQQKIIRINEERLRRIVNLEADMHQLKAITTFLKSQKRQLNQYIRKEVEPIKEAKHKFDIGRLQISNDLSRLEQKLDVNCNFISNEIEHIKEPLQYQINDIKQEKDQILRELEKVYRNNRDLAVINSTLKDQYESSFVNSQSQLKSNAGLNQTILSWHSNSRERLQTRQSESRYKLYNNTTILNNKTFDGKLNQSLENGLISGDNDNLSPDIIQKKQKATFLDSRLDRIERPITSVSNAETQKPSQRKMRKNISRNNSRQMTQTANKHYQTQQMNSERKKAFENTQESLNNYGQKIIAQETYMKIDQNSEEENDSDFKRDKTQFKNFLHSDLNNVSINQTPNVLVKNLKKRGGNSKKGSQNQRNYSMNENNKNNLHVVVPTTEIMDKNDNSYDYQKFNSQGNSHSKAYSALRLNKFKHIFNHIN